MTAGAVPDRSGPARLAGLLLAVLGVVLAIGFARSWAGLDAGPRGPWWAYLFLGLLAVALAALAAAVVVSPWSAVLRRALAGTALAWLIAFGLAAAARLDITPSDRDPWLLVGMAVVAAAGLALLLTSLGDAETRRGPAGRVVDVIAFGGAQLVAVATVVLAASLVRAAWRWMSAADPVDRVPWGLLAVIVVLPVVTFTIAAIGARRAAEGTFQAQAAANRRNSVLLVITLVGIVAATAGIIGVVVTFQPVPGLWAAAGATLVGIGAAVLADRFGANLILETAGARRADEADDRVLVDVVRELSIAADLPMPAVYVVPDGSRNAFATGRDPAHASVAVTSGLLERLDREQLQGVIGHELGHVRNLDTRYALFVAVLVGLVALVTDGFLRIVIEGWRHGAFVWSDDDNPIASLALGFLVGIFLLVVAVLLWILAPLFSALVQAATSREREYLADTTSVEFTRNPRALERALEAIADDTDPLEAANRGTQHLWFSNPVKAGSDRRVSWLSTHPSIGARIERLRRLQGLGPAAVPAADATD